MKGLLFLYREGILYGGVAKNYIMYWGVLRLL